MINVARIRTVLAFATLAGSGTYFFLYLYRWEWNRAIVSGVIFLAAELALIGWLLSDRIRGMQQRLDRPTEPDQQVLTRLRETAPDARVNFEWLRPNDQLSVFVPVLMGAGVVLSALAWAVERLARVTARPVAERGLARRLDVLAIPTRGLLAHDDDGLEMLRGPVAGSWR
jgi:hypothetical protein